MKRNVFIALDLDESMKVFAAVVHEAEHLTRQRTHERVVFGVHCCDDRSKLFDWTTERAFVDRRIDRLRTNRVMGECDSQIRSSESPRTYFKHCRTTLGRVDYTTADLKQKLTTSLLIKMLINRHACKEAKSHSGGTGIRWPVSPSIGLTNLVVTD